MTPTRSAARCCCLPLIILFPRLLKRSDSFSDAIDRVPTFVIISVILPVIPVYQATVNFL
jgi:hypothetical protein